MISHVYSINCHNFASNPKLKYKTNTKRLPTFQYAIKLTPEQVESYPLFCL